MALYPILDQDVGCSFLKLCHCIIIHIDISEVIHHNNNKNGHTFYTDGEYKSKVCESEIKMYKSEFHAKSD